MSESIYLSDAEICEISGRERPTAQLKWLRKNGFTAKPRADGTILVSRRNYEIVMGGYTEMKSNFAEPDYAAAIE